MRIKNSIKTVTVFPIMIVIFLSAYIVVAEYLSFKTIENTTKNISEVENLKNLLIESLTEREIAIQTILSNSNEKNYDYNQQIKKTNSIVNSIVNIYNQNKDDKLIYKIIEDIKQIVNIRNDVKNRKRTNWVKKK
jgi:predicted PurR-regulated permease PerM